MLFRNHGLVPRKDKGANYTEKSVEEASARHHRIRFAVNKPRVTSAIGVSVSRFIPLDQHRAAELQDLGTDISRKAEHASKIRGL